MRLRSIKFATSESSSAGSFGVPLFEFTRDRLAAGLAGLSDMLMALRL